MCMGDEFMGNFHSNVLRVVGVGADSKSARKLSWFELHGEGKKMNRITKQQFLKAFEEEWMQQLEFNWDELSNKWAASREVPGQKRPWTLFMLNPGGFIDSVRERLTDIISPLKYTPEMYQIDAAFVGGVDLFRGNLSYPSTLHVLIEHEAESNVEEELWELIFWRSPLKVLISYDHDDHKKVSKQSKVWLENKLSILQNMIRTARNDSACTDDSEYLFIFGARESINGEIYWRWASEEGQEFTTFSGGD